MYSSRTSPGNVPDKRSKNHLQAADSLAQTVNGGLVGYICIQYETIVGKLYRKTALAQFCYGVHTRSW